MDPRLIGLSGFAGCGKSTVATVLSLLRGATRIKFADPLKDMLRALGLSEEMIEGNQKHSPQDILRGKTPREAMISLGTEWGRELIGGDIWTNAWASRVNETEGTIVTDDVRFMNEYEELRRQGGILIAINRPDQDNLTDATHASEVMIPQLREMADFVIVNNADLASLRRVTCKVNEAIG